MPMIVGPLTISMFLGSFAWSFAFISLPFYIQAISPYDAAVTLRWAGWILGISSLVTVVTWPSCTTLTSGWIENGSVTQTQPLVW